MVIRNLTLILVVAILFGAFLIVQPRYQHSVQQPSIEDRLPDATWHAIIDCVDFSKEINNLLFRYKMPHRDFLTPDFILSQAKIYGIRLMEAIFIFYNSNDDWGIVAPISENANLKLGIERLKHFFDIKELFINRHKVYYISQYNMYLFHGYNYICLYVGQDIATKIMRIAYSKPNQISPEWISIRQKYQMGNNNLFVCGHPKYLKNLSFEQINIFPAFDSTHVYLHTVLTSKDTIPFKLKTEGINFQLGEFTKQALNLHFHVEQLKAKPNHPIYRFLQQQSKKISFPFNEFFQQWNGDLSFRKGGWININETYIDHELDENFEVSEIQKTRQRQVIGFDICYSLEPKSKKIRQKLSKSGFLTQQEQKYHLLLSPPLNFKKIKNDSTYTHTFYTSSYPPLMVKEANSYLLWTHKQTQYTLSIDSINTFEIHGNIRFNPEKIKFQSIF